jgi:VIT1/CCC1 family predicted Fe2+/Mn2+ transporter
VRRPYEVPSCALDDSHTPEAIARRLASEPSPSYLRDAVYGAIDGAVTTFAIVAGVVGAELSPKIVLILGTANLFGDGLSMALSNYLGTRTFHQELSRARHEERHHIRTVPDGEREEVRQIFRAKGLTGTTLEEVVEVMTADEEQWIDIMVREELGLHPTRHVPWKAGMTTFLAFCAAGSFPLALFLVEALTGVTTAHPFGWTTAITAIAFFLIGAGKSRFTDQPWYRSGLETLVVGGLAASVAYAIGAALAGWS